MIAAGEFVEWAHGVRLSLRHAQGAGEGRRFARAATSCSTSTGRAPSSSSGDFGEHLVTIFLLPPSMAELEQRLHSRGQDCEEVIADRMRRAAGEIEPLGRI